MVIACIWLSVISLALALYAYRLHIKLNEKVEVDNQTRARNHEIAVDNDRLVRANDELLEQVAEQEKELKNLDGKKKSKEEEINALTEQVIHIETSLTAQKTVAKEAYEDYCKLLDKQYKDTKASFEELSIVTEEEYKQLQENLEKAYGNRQAKILADLDDAEAELGKIRETRDAAIKAAAREQEIKEQLSFYCLPLSDADATDIAVLESVKSRLAKPRILNMLIWQTYYQKAMNTLCANVVKGSVTGIYKITNIQNGMCYIGQAADIASRWKDHAKCMLGIDTPPGNKLYKTAMEIGIQNFSWEVLETCSRTELNEKERFYIDLYQAKEYGYNSTIGVH